LKQKFPRQIYRTRHSEQVGKVTVHKNTNYKETNCKLNSSCYPKNSENHKEIEVLRNSDLKYKIMNIHSLHQCTSRQTTKCRLERHKSFGINIGSSRGATELFEKYPRKIPHNWKHNVNITNHNTRR
jgi:hypothetical protein